jgi:hypothetical protein
MKAVMKHLISRSSSLKKLTLLAAAVVLLSGCTQRYIDFTTISSKNMDMSRGAEFERGTQRVVGEDMSHIIVFIPTGQPNAKEALDRAIEGTPGAVALLDGVITHKFWWIPYIYGQSSIEVEGTPLIDPRLKPGYRAANTQTIPLRTSLAQ